MEFEERRIMKPLTSDIIKQLFPDWQEAAQEQLTLYENRREAILDHLRFNLFTLPDDVVDDEYLGPLTPMDREVLRLHLMTLATENLKWIDAQLFRLRSIIGAAKSRKQNRFMITSFDIARARVIPIPLIIPHIQFREAGCRLVGLCPLHGEKTPSFNVFADGRFKCFGCQQSGDSIALYRLLNPGLGFVDAVRAMNVRWPA